MHTCVECGRLVYTDKHNYIYENKHNYHTKKCTKCEYETEEEHVSEYTNINDELNHREYCTICHHIGISYHNYQCYGTIGDFHSEACADCGYARMGVTNAVCTSIDANNHSRICPDCEYTISTEPHNWVYTSISALYHEGYCADCGEIKVSQESHSWKVASNPQYVECQYCGHLKSKPTIGGGEIIPVQPFKEDEIEEETE